MPVTSPKRPACPVVNFAPGVSIPWEDFKRIVQGAIKRFSNGSADVELREEILSETAVRVCAAVARPGFKLTNSLPNYIFTVAKNQTIRHWHGVQRRGEKAEQNVEWGYQRCEWDLEDLVTDAPNSETSLIKAEVARERREKLRRVMDGLGPIEKDALKIRYLEPRTTPLTARERQAVRRAKAKIKELVR